MWWALGVGIVLLGIAYAFLLCCDTVICAADDEDYHEGWHR